MHSTIHADCRDGRAAAQRHPRHSCREAARVVANEGTFWGHTRHITRHPTHDGRHAIRTRVRARLGGAVTRHGDADVERGGPLYHLVRGIARNRLVAPLVLHEVPLARAHDMRAERTGRKQTAANTGDVRAQHTHLSATRAQECTRRVAAPPYDAKRPPCRGALRESCVAVSGSPTAAPAGQTPPRRETRMT